MLQKKLFALVLFGIMVLTLAGCGSSSSNGNNGGNGPATATGRFIDSPVAGLSYLSGSVTGTTDASGSFTYEVGQSVTFKIGGIVLGTIPAQGIITPVDLVSGATATDPAVTKITQFLMTLDSDNDPSNGITIPAAVATAAAGKTFDFTTADDTTLGAFVSQLGCANTLVSASAAQTHLTDNILNLYVGTYEGTLTSPQHPGESGTFSITISTAGTITGAYSVPVAGVSGTFTGTMLTNSGFTLTTNDGDTATGTINPSSGGFSATLTSNGDTVNLTGSRSTTTTTGGGTPATGANYYPHTAGSTWTYNVTKDSGPFIETDTILSASGSNFTLKQVYGSATDYDVTNMALQSDGSMVMSQIASTESGATTTITFNPAVVRIPSFSATTGSTTGSITATTSAGSATGTATISYTVDGTESVTVPAGTFTCKKVTASQTMTVTGMGAQTQSITLWFADGVGLIKSLEPANGNRSMVLASYSIH